MLGELCEQYPDKEDEWGYWVDIFDEFSDRDNREMWSIKKPSKTIIRAVVDEMMTEGKTLEELYENVDNVADRILEKHPELEHDYG